MLTAGKYEKSKDIYAKVKNSNYRISIWQVRPYFYSIKQLNQKEKLQKEFEELLEIKNEEIEEVKNSEFKREQIKYKKREEIRERK